MNRFCETSFKNEVLKIKKCNFEAQKRNFCARCPLVFLHGDLYFFMTYFFFWGGEKFNVIYYFIYLVLSFNSFFNFFYYFLGGRFRVCGVRYCRWASVNLWARCTIRSR